MKEDGKRKLLDEMERKRKWRKRKGLEEKLTLSSTEEEKKMEGWTDRGLTGKVNSVVISLELGFGVSFYSKLSKHIGCIEREVQC